MCSGCVVCVLVYVLVCKSVIVSVRMQWLV